MGSRFEGTAAREGDVLRFPLRDSDGSPPAGRLRITMAVFRSAFVVLPQPMHLKAAMAGCWDRCGGTGRIPGRNTPGFSR